MRPFRLKAFIARVKALPVTLGHIERVLTDSIPAIEELTGALKLIATHIHVPVMGNVYSITVWEEVPGAFSERQVMRNDLVKELGRPTVEEEITDGCRLFFLSEDKRPPRTHVHKVLGDHRIAQLCAPLNTEGRAAIDEALAAMEVLLRDIDAKVKAIRAILGKLPPESIVVANGVLMAIVREFGLKNR